ncbi:MAG TPA: two-component sensor histidine kinase, partial [Gammaproteobacteria bacterium]|nr:two-component sensor histidine kinase [Gammaproteobacteria bacterium]
QPLPNTNNMRGYLSRDEAKSGVPSELKAFPPGYMGAIETTAGGSMVLVSRQFDADLYLVFASENVSQLAFFFGILP